MEIYSVGIRILRHEITFTAKSVKSLNLEKSPSEEPNNANYRLMNALNQLHIERAQRRILEYRYDSRVKNRYLKSWGVPISLKFSKALISWVVHLEYI